MLSSLMFATVGGWPDFRKWGYADNVLYDAVSERYSVVRERVKGFQHQWHPPACARSRLAGQAGTPLDQG